jgi:hypothetical protein
MGWIDKAKNYAEGAVHTVGQKVKIAQMEEDERNRITKQQEYEYGKKFAAEKAKIDYNQRIKSYKSEKSGGSRPLANMWGMGGQQERTKIITHKGKKTTTRYVNAPKQQYGLTQPSFGGGLTQPDMSGRLTQPNMGGLTQPNMGGGLSQANFNMGPMTNPFKKR